MHPSIALQVAERELLEENEQLPHEGLTPPPPFLHFAPRVHQKRRTMTGVLAGYFDQPPPNRPLPILPEVQDLLARTAAPAMGEEELAKLEIERKRIEKANARKGRPNMVKPRADNATGIVVANTKRSQNRSSTRSDSPLTDSRILSDESTPPMTPTTPKSDYSLHDSHRYNTEKAKKKAEHGDRPSPFTRVPLPLVKANAAAKAAGFTKSSTIEVGKKRKAAEMDIPMQRDRKMTTAVASSTTSTKPKTRPGWKGWVEVDGSPEPKTKLINLDVPVETLQKRTRSGRAPAPTPPVIKPRKPSTAKSSTRASTQAPETPGLSSASTTHVDVHLEGTIFGSTLSEEPKAGL